MAADHLLLSAPWRPTASCAPASSPRTTTRWVARELRRQGLTPVYVGAKQKRARVKTALLRPAAAATFSSSPRSFPRCSTPACRSIARFRSPASSPTRPIPHHRPRHPAVHQGRQIAGGQRWPSTPTYSRISSSTWCARAKPPEASASIFDRLSEFERSRDELRGYIISSMIYPSARARRRGLHFVLLEFRGAALRHVFEHSRMEIPLPT